MRPGPAYRAVSPRRTHRATVARMGDTRTGHTASRAPRRDPVPSADAPPDGTEPLLVSRFAVPPLPPTFVRRARLLERLTAGAAGPLTLVTGPAGAGKTLCVADWAGHGPAPRAGAWLTVEQGCTSPGPFWAHVLGAMRHHGVSLPPGTGRPGRAPAAVDDTALARLAAHLESRAEPVLLVLDGFDRVTAPEVAAQVEFVLRHAGQGLRLVLVCRARPLLALHRWRVAGEVTEVRAADLAFGPRETAALLVRHGLRPSAEQARLLADRTEGWAAGIRLYALAAARGDDPATGRADLDAEHGTVADFLLGEVLAAQPPAARDLLLRASVLEQVEPDLADALTGREDAEGLLAELERANAFVRAVGPSRYRVHPLFARALRARLRSRCPGLERELRCAAARRLRATGRLADALPHAAAAGEWASAAELFVGSLAVGRLLTDVGRQGLDADLAGLPDDVPGAAAHLLRAARGLARYDVAAGVVQLRRAEEELRRRPQDRVEARLSLALLRVLASRLLGSADRAEAAFLEAGRLGRLVPAAEREPHPELSALLLANLGAARLWAGRLDSAREALTAAVALPDVPETAAPRHEALGRIALIDFLSGWYLRAEDSARSAVLVAERAGLPVARCDGVAHLVLAGVAVERDALGAARTALRRAASSAGYGNDPLVTSGVATMRARALLAEGDTRACLRALAEADDRSPAGVRSPWVGARVALAEATAHLADQEPAAALRALDAVSADSTERAVVAARARLAQGDHPSALDLLAAHPVAPGEGPALVVRAVLARAEIAERLGETRTARRLALRALDIAGPERLRRPFLECGPWLGRVLRGHAGPDGAGLPGAGTADRPDPAGADADARAVVVEPLSGRERDVLRQVAQLKSTEEVAEDLFLSVNTVKSHLKSIFRKLGATRRGEAVRRARELDLI
ncbi:LuxR family transcriptional regulator, maltose regulon positive regulatory protein [Streptomyces sp. SolWspMP-5a-2]|nr:LuxR family transcriptional regulator, maltose regulon positive regulatory protein [Streptomyces sp. SolWspMP-5a-2]